MTKESLIQFLINNPGFEKSRMLDKNLVSSLSIQDKEIIKNGRLFNISKARNEINKLMESVKNLK